MARALIGGLLAKGLASGQIGVSDPSPECCDAARQMGVQVYDDNATLVANSSIVVLAIKPQVMREVLEPLASLLPKKPPLFISIAAGIGCDPITAWLAHDVGLVRCMPNTPALLQEGAAALYASSSVTAEQRLQAEKILQSVGLAVWVENEAELDAVTALSGSGPAYFFLMMELMQQAGEKLGLSTDACRQLTLQTALGAAKMAIESDVDVVELRRRVTSPNGTTHAAIQAFLDNDFAEVIERALTAARDRSIEMSEELNR